MAKSIPKVFNSARVLFLIAFLLTAFFIFHVTNFSTLFDNKQSTGAIDNLRKQNIVSKPRFTKIDLEVVEKINVEPEFHETHLEPEHPAATPPSSEITHKIVEIEHTAGFINHKILLLNDEDFGSTSVGELMSTYGEADGGGSCQGDFGNQLVKRWREVKSRYCGSSDEDIAKDKEQNPNKLGTSVDCHLIHQTRHHGSGDQLCVYHNAMVNLALFNNEELTTSVVQEYVQTMHAKQPYIKFPQNFIKGDCKPSEYWVSRLQPGWNADLTVGAYTKDDSLSSTECDLWIDHPVMITERDTFANFFHDSEDFFNVFLAMAILEWKKEDTQMFLTDLYPEGPFWEMWSKVFSSSSGKLQAMTAWDLKKKFRNVGNKDLTNVNKICFKNLAIGIYGPAAPMTVASWDTPCKKTALIRAYSDYVIRGLNLQHLTHYANEKPLKTITITYMARRPSKEWPERKYCNTTDSFFTCSYWDHFGERKLGRMVRNDAEVVQSLKNLEKENFDGKIIKVQDVDYNILNFEEQISIDIGTDIMIGAHGAGLMHNIFMRDRASLIELFVDGSAVNRHFHNLAFWYGRRYNGISIENPINVRELLNIVRRDIDAIDVDSY